MKAHYCEQAFSEAGVSWAARCNSVSPNTPEPLPIEEVEIKVGEIEEIDDDRNQPKEKLPAMRIQFEFSDSAIEELDALRETLNARSRGEVINHAIGLLKWLVKEKRTHDSRIVVERGESKVEVVFPQLESALLTNDTE